MNFTYLENLTAPDLGLNNTFSNNNYIPEMVTTANDVSLGYFGLGVMVVSFIVMTVLLNNPFGESRLSIIKSMFISSGISTLLGTVMLVSGLIVSLQHVIWFLILFGLLFFIVKHIKNKTG